MIITNKLKILILGVGNAQIDALRYCKEQGYEVHALSYKAEGPGIEIANHFTVINIIDKEAVAEYCAQNNIHIIYSVGSDIAMPTVGYVAKKLNLPLLVEEQTANLLNNKVALRKHLNANNISPISFTEASNLKELKEWNTYPAILKPVDSQGQRGVYEINSAEDIIKYFDKSIANSFRKKVILEEYINGKEISVNAFVLKGEVKYAFISDRRVVEDLPGGIVKGHDFPTTMPLEMQEQTTHMVKKSIASLNIKNGPVYYQIKYTNHGPRIIEITGRLDGCHIWRLVKMNYGVNLLDLTFRILLGEEPEFSVPIEKGNMKIDFPLQKPGSIFNQELHSGLLKNSLFYEFYYSENETIRPVNGHMEKTGIIIK